MTDRESKDGEPRERASKEGRPPELPVLTKPEAAEREAENALRQYDLMLALIASANSDGASFRLRPSTLMKLNHAAVAGLHERPGQLRPTPIVISGTDHRPPPPEECAELVDELCDYVNDHWDQSTALHLSAYVMWRLNWVHPFGDGNGRTSRAASFLVLCARLGYSLPGEKTIPEMISENKQPYYEALDAADAAYARGEIDVSKMEALLEEHLAKMLVSVFEDAKA